MLNRLSDVSLQTQPPSLRHRTIVRDSSIKERAMYYLYRTFDNFQRVVDMGETSWEAVGPTDMSVLEKPKLDKWGFAEVGKDLLQVKDGSATLAACSDAYKEFRYHPKVSDPLVKREANGAWKLSWDRREAKPGRPRAAVLRNSPQPAIRRISNEGAPEEEIPKSDVQTPRGPEMIRGLTRSEYNRQYRLKMIERELRKARIPQLKRYATWLARNEATEELNKTATQDREFEFSDRELLHCGQQEAPSSNDAPPIRPESSLKRRGEELPRGAGQKRQKASQPENQDVVEPIQMTESSTSAAIADSRNNQPPIRLPSDLEISPDRVSELIEYLQDTTLPGVHINPVGSINYLPRGKKQKGRKVLVVSFRFDWLSKFDWFVHPPELERAEKENVATPGSIATAKQNEGMNDQQLTPSKRPHIALSETQSEDRQARKRRGRPPGKGNKTPQIPRKSLGSAAALDKNHDSQEVSNMPGAEDFMSSGPASAEKDLPVNELTIPQDQLNQELNPNQPPAGVELEADNIKRTPGVSGLRDGAENHLLKTPQPATPINSTPVLLSLGSARFKRTRLLMDIVDQCDGIIGADKELVLAFQHEQRKRNEQVADRYTIMRAVKNLVDQGKLQRVVVVFNDQKGRAVTKPILLRPGVSINSQVAKDAIKKMEELHPMLYIPLDVPQELKPKKPVSRYNRKDDTIAFQTVPVNQTVLVDRPEEVPPWEAYFLSRKRMLADRRNERFQTRKRRRLAKKGAIQEPANETPSLDAPVQDSAMQDASIQEVFIQETSLQDASLRDISIQDTSKPDSTQGIPVPDISIERPAYPVNNRRYRFVIMGPSDGKYQIGENSNWDDMESSRRNRRIQNQFFGSNANERRKFFARQAQHEQSILTPRHVFCPATGTYSTAFTILRGRQAPFKPASQYFGPPFREYPVYAVEDDAESPPRQDSEEGVALADRPIAFRQLDPKCVITPKAAKMLLYACVAIRTLAGGKDRSMNWAILDQVFADYPHYSQHNFRSRWFWMTKNHANLVNKLQSEFETLFLEAYEAGELPPFRLLRPDTYHWGALVEWMEENIDLLAQRDSLPADRAKFDARCIVHVTPTDTPANREKYFLTSSSSVKRHIFVNSINFTLPTPSRDASGYTYDEQVARSWIRAAVQLEAVVDPRKDEKLRTLSEEARRRAIQTLLDEKVIAKSRPGRSQHFKIKPEPDAFKKRRLLSPGDFAEAAAFKARLDAVAAERPAAAAGGGQRRGLPVDMGVRNGEMLAATELAARGRVRVAARLPRVDSTVGAPWPRLSVWGFGEGLYEGKKADKRRLLWPVDVVPAAGYVAGLPLGAAIAGRPVPRAREGDPPGWERVPYWMDLRGGFVEAKWRELLMALLTALALRAGSTVSVLVESSGGFLFPWEVELALDWLVDVGAVARTGEGNVRESGYVTGEWWWTVLFDEQTFVAPEH
jgi:hypothetical protein